MINTCIMTSHLRHGERGSVIFDRIVSECHIKIEDHCKGAAIGNKVQLYSTTEEAIAYHNLHKYVTQRRPEHITSNSWGNH